MNYDFKKISLIAVQALDIAGEGNLAQAEKLYREVILHAEQCDHYQLPDFYHQLASVLSQMDRLEEALHFYEMGLAISLKQANNDNSDIGVGVSRYFLGEQLLKMKRYKDAVNMTAPSLNKSEIGSRLLPMIKAIALWNLGRKDEAKVIANEVIDSAPSEEKKQGFSQRFNKEFN
jgi:tetratricopeptide (TPR) repeat protein